jgi:hypothetical protein
MGSARNRCFLYLRHSSAIHAFTVLYIMCSVQYPIMQQKQSMNLCASRAFSADFLKPYLYPFFCLKHTYFELHCAKLKFSVGHFYMKTGR